MNYGIFIWIIYVSLITLIKLTSNEPSSEQFLFCDLHFWHSQLKAIFLWSSGTNPLKANKKYIRWSEPARYFNQFGNPGIGQFIHHYAFLFYSKESLWSSEKLLPICSSNKEYRLQSSRWCTTSKAGKYEHSNKGDCNSTRWRCRTLRSCSIYVLQNRAAKILVRPCLCPYSQYGTAFRRSTCPDMG